MFEFSTEYLETSNLEIKAIEYAPSFDKSKTSYYIYNSETKVVFIYSE